MKLKPHSLETVLKLFFFLSFISLCVLQFNAWQAQQRTYSPCTALLACRPVYVSYLWLQRSYSPSSYVCLSVSSSACVVLCAFVSPCRTIELQYRVQMATASSVLCCSTDNSIKDASDHPSVSRS